MEPDAERAVGDRPPFTMDSEHMAKYIATLSPDEQEALVVKLARNEARARLQRLMREAESRNQLNDSQTSTSGVYYDRACALLIELVGSAVANRTLVRLVSRDAQSIIEFLDQVLVTDTITNLDDRARTHLILSEIEMLAETHPTSYNISQVTFEGLHKQEASSLIYSGSYRGCRIQIKEFQLYSAGRGESMKRLIRELSSWPHLRHRNILPFYGVVDSALDDRASRKLGLVSPWVETNLTEYLAASPSAPRDLLVSDIASGLEYLHDMRLVHGDLRGSNILVVKTEVPVAVITNFDFCSPVEGSLTVPEVTLDTDAVHWMAPELVGSDTRQRRRTQPSDVWSLGCVCYEVIYSTSIFTERISSALQIFTGRVPFYQCTSIQELILTLQLAKYGTVSPLRPLEGQGSRALPPVKDETWSTMESCWEREPSKRSDSKTLARFFASKRANFEQSSTGDPFSSHEMAGSALRVLEIARSNPGVDYRHIYQLLRQAQVQLQTVEPLSTVPKAQVPI
ncbi:hypothetical protein NP233_g4744 [Leucocoprinus birnbaumii]|uniref:Protein kinase domain-containing protein n=1 Tax=Leucocoprinus birnbaumii TaxID=56174 RepID=A0AAD5YXA6_9AGAR|nr:hypothetical protein NP233_g4744 [Leucocoprinus birnbaumii]